MLPVYTCTLALAECTQPQLKMLSPPITEYSTRGIGTRGPGPPHFQRMGSQRVSIHVGGTRVCSISRVFWPLTGVSACSYAPMYNTSCSSSSCLIS